MLFGIQLIAARRVGTAGKLECKLGVVKGRQGGLLIDADARIYANDPVRGLMLAFHFFASRVSKGREEMDRVARVLLACTCPTRPTVP